MSATVSAERLWQTERMVRAAQLVRPKSVLEVGYPYGREDLLDIWGCPVSTVDPHGDRATHKMRFEDFGEGHLYNVVNMTSVLDYLDDPMAGLRVARSVGNWVLVQGRLNTYTHPQFETMYWTPTRRWVSERMCDVLHIAEPQWVEFFGKQMFSVFGKVS